MTEAINDDAVAEALPAVESAETAEVIDPARQAEIDALAAELQGVKPEKPKRTRRVTAKNPAAFTPTEAPAVEPAPAVDAVAEEAPAAEPVADAATSEEAEAEQAVEAVDAVDALDAAAAETAVEAPAGDEAEGAEESEDGADGTTSAEGGSSRSRSRRGRNRNRGRSGDEQGEGQTETEDRPAASSGGANGNGNGNANGSANANRDRNRKRGGTRNDDELEPEILPDDVLIPIAGILDVLDNYAFVRTTGYLPGVTDVYVSLGQVKKYGLRRGDAVVGAIRQPREGEQQGRQKYNALVRVDSVNGQTEEQSLARVEFAAGTPIRATDALVTAAKVSAKEGERVLVLGATADTVGAIAAAINKAHQDVHLMVILVGPKPEDVTELRRSVKGEVVVSALEQSVEDHVTVVELAIERAKRLVELGVEVAIVIDSITELGRAYFSLAPVSRAHADDPSFTLPAKRLFASARKLEDAASLTIIATAKTGVAVDQLVVAELGSIANAVVTL